MTENETEEDAVSIMDVDQWALSPGEDESEIGVHCTRCKPGKWGAREIGWVISLGGVTPVALRDVLAQMEEHRRIGCDGAWNEVVVEAEMKHGGIDRETAIRRLEAEL